MRSRSIVIDGSDLRFALTRCWSEGDSNRRSLLGLLLLGDCSKSARFPQGCAMNIASEKTSPSRFLGMTALKSPAPRAFPEYAERSPARLVGKRAEGVADLVFEEQVGGRPCWTVVDFKTDLEIGGHLARYRAQLEIYMRGIAQSTGVGARRPAVVRAVSASAACRPRRLPPPTSVGYATTLEYRASRRESLRANRSKASRH